MASVPLRPEGLGPASLLGSHPVSPWGPRAFLSLQAGKLGFPSWEHKGTELLEPGEETEGYGPASS